MGLGDFVNKAKNLADQHDEQVDQGLDRAGDTTAAGVEPASEVPGGPETDVPAGPGNVPPQQ